MVMFICTLLITFVISLDPVELSPAPPRRADKQHYETGERIIGEHNNGSLYYPILVTGPTETGSGQQTPHQQTPVRIRLVPDGRADGVYNNGRLMYTNAVGNAFETGSGQQPRHQQPRNQQPPARVRLLPDRRVDGIYNNGRLVHINPVRNAVGTGSVYQPRYQQPRLQQAPRQQLPLPLAVSIIYNNRRPVHPVPTRIPVETGAILPNGALVFRNSNLLGRVKDGEIYESNATGPNVQARRIDPRHGDLVIKNGRPVSIYDNNFFRTYRIPPQL